MNILILMAGSSQAFYDRGYGYPKTLVEIDGMPMIERVISNLDTLIKLSSRVSFVVGKEDNRKFHLDQIIRLLIPEAIVYEANHTAGAACSSLLAIEEIDSEEPLFIINGDQIVDVDFKKILEVFQGNSWDGGTVVFEAIHPRWSYVKCDEEGMVIEAAEKRPISKNATAGIYYFSNGSLFVECSMEMIYKDAHLNGLFYVCPVFNEMVLRQKKVGIYKIPPKSYHSFMTPQQMESYQNFLQIESRKSHG